MLHILWIILKIILIVFASLAGLALVLILLVLFCPIRYMGNGEKGADVVRGEVNISWLFHIVSVWAGYREGNSWMDIKIFGISLTKAKAFLEKFKGKSRQKQPPDKTPVQEDPQESLVEKPELSFEAAPPEEKLLTESDGPFGVLKKFFCAIGRFFRKIFTTFMGIISLFWKIPQKVFGIVHKISLTITGFCAKIDWWGSFLEDERTRAAISLGWNQVKKILCHIAPRKINGNVIFGFEDPSSTGQVLALLGATCPIHKNPVSFTPVFDQKVLEGHIMIKGRVYLVMLVKTAIMLYFNKDVKYVIKVMEK